MKRLYLFILGLSCLICLQGCAEKEEPVIFYYPHAQILHHSDAGIIGQETR